MNDSYSHFISVVIPIFNESSNIKPLITRLVGVLKNYDSYEIILVDDGSSDDSVELIHQFSAQNKSVKLISLSRNFGHQVAITTGLSHAKGDAVMVMDGDLQDPPESIPEFVNKWQEGYQVVYAVRRKRKENVFKRMAYFSFYRIFNMMSKMDIPLDSGDFSLIDRKVLDILNAFPEKNRFYRGLRTWVGFNQIGIEYERQARNSGDPKFTLKKLIGLALDGLISFSSAPLKFIIASGMALTALSLIGIGFIIYVKLFNVNSTMELQGWASTMVTVVFFAGVQFMFLGIMGGYLAKIFDEVKQRPKYVVKHTVNLEVDN